MAVVSLGAKALPFPPRVQEAVGRVRADKRCNSALVFGSYARGTACHPVSDVDVLVVHAGPVPEDLLDELPQLVSVAFYTPSRLRDLTRRSPLFAVHLAREAVVERDDHGLLKKTLAAVGPLGREGYEQVASLTSRRARDLAEDSGVQVGDRGAAAELYALGKQAALLASAATGVYEFDRHRAFDQLALRRPKLQGAIDEISALEPWWLRARDPAMRQKAADERLGGLPFSALTDLMRAVSGHERPAGRR